MLVAGPISFAPDAALAADGGAFSDSTTLTLAGRSRPRGRRLVVGAGAAPPRAARRRRRSAAAAPAAAA